MDLKDAIEALKGADRTQVLELLERDAGGLHQAIFQKGYDVAHGRKNKDVETLKGDVARLTTELATASEALKAVSSTGTPPSPQVKDYELELKRLRDEALEREKLNVKKLQQKDVDLTVRDVRTKLTQRGVDPDYAEVLTQKPELLARVQPQDDGTIQIMQEGKSIPVAHDASKSPIDALVEEILPRVPAKFLVSTVGNGSGDRGGAGPAGSTLYDEIRRDQREKLDTARNEREAAAKIARERLGMNIV